MKTLNYISVLIIFSVDYCGAQIPDASTFADLLARIKRLEDADKLRERETATQEDIIKSLQNELQREKQLREVSERQLSAQVLQQARVLQQQRAQFRDLLQNVQGLTRGVGGISLRRSNRQVVPETVAFHATLDRDGALEHITVGSTIPFPNTKLNIGSGYDNSSSTFTAPYAGIYIFSVSISSYWNDKGELHVGIMKNGVYVAGAYVDDIGGPPEQGSVTIPLQLDVGDKVWIKHVVHDDGALYGGGLTSFMGCMVYAL